MTIYFSPSSLSFIDTDLSSLTPDNCVEISKEQHKELLCVPVGFVLNCDENGFPVFCEAPKHIKTTKEKIEDLERLITQRRIRESILTQDGEAWLFDIEKQIATLREGL